MDDDDYYPPTRISHAVEMLTEHPDVLCAGCSKIYVYFTDNKEIYKLCPYHSNHATANTFAFKRELLEETKYEDDATFAEEKYFLKNYTVPMIQLNTLKTILVISHNSNTYDKRQILQYSQKQKFVESVYSFWIFTRIVFLIQYKELILFMYNKQSNMERPRPSWNEYFKKIVLCTSERSLVLV